jgi:hypothetical protein
MNIKKMTSIFSLIAFVVIAIYDVYAITKGGTEASISHMLIVSSYKYPVMTFGFGFLCGHLFWRVRDTKDTIKISKDTRGE